MSATPRTDAAISIYHHCPAVDIKVCRALEREISELRRALLQARDWGVTSKGYSARESINLADWIDAGMVGTAPELPNYYPPFK